ncbi:hypothetical protein EYF80_023568 [Liparis tanakae]|uniref:Uncharacterized protein n=1 Tax=Liparis tanakae TaxID=230148 RepID=A0A4Z2HK10_9TELE|nr:hypothetical protein EYF80_023568 [Liparis tanakae]
MESERWLQLAEMGLELSRPPCRGEMEKSCWVWEEQGEGYKESDEVKKGEREQERLFPLAGTAMSHPSPIPHMRGPAQRAARPLI